MTLTRRIVAKRNGRAFLGLARQVCLAALKRAGIQRTAYTLRVEVDSERDALDQARKNSAMITGVEVDGVYQRYEAAMDISEGSVVMFQPPSRHEIISDEKQIIKSSPT